MGGTSIGAFADHAGDTQPTVGQSVFPINFLVSKSSRHPEDSAVGQDGLLRLVGSPHGDRKNCEVRHSLVHTRNPADGIIVFQLLRGTGQPGSDFQDPFRPEFPLQPHSGDLTEFGLGGERIGGTHPAGQKWPHGPHLLQRQAFEEDLGRDDLPAGPGAEPWNRSLVQ